MTVYSFNVSIMALVYVTHPIPKIGISLLENAGHEVVIGPVTMRSKNDLLSDLKQRPYDAVLSLLTNVIDADVLTAIPDVKVIANYAVGFNNIDVMAAKDKGIVVTNTPGVLTDTVAEFTVALILAVTKRIPEGDRLVRAGKFTGWEAELLLGSDLKGKTLGILGAGRIGSGVATRMQQGFGMKIVYNDIQPVPVFETGLTCTYLDSVKAVLASADIVSIHVPLTDETRHLIDTEALSCMKPSAYLINTSRGPVVDEDALVQALKAGLIAGAGLDVFEREPVLADELSTLDNVVLTPHIASGSIETRSKMAEIAASNIIAVLAGEIAPNQVS